MEIYLLVGDIFLGLILLVHLARWWQENGKWRRQKRQAIKRKFRRQ
jgi:hypothetical protein